MNGKIHINDLTEDTKKKLNLSSPAVQPKVIALGRILQDLQGLSNREAIWALRNAIYHVKGFREKVK